MLQRKYENKQQAIPSLLWIWRKVEGTTSSDRVSNGEVLAETGENMNSST